MATAGRLRAVVEAYDIRPAAIEKIRSLGASAVEPALDMIQSEDAGGYAQQQDADAAAARLAVTDVTRALNEL